MKLSREDVLKLAKLSRLQLSEAEIYRYQKELSQILEYVEQLDSVDVTGLLPTYQVTGLTSEDSNSMRDDEILEQVSQDDLLKNVPHKEKDGHIRVERMIE